MTFPWMSLPVNLQYEIANVSSLHTSVRVIETVDLGNVVVNVLRVVVEVLVLVLVVVSRAGTYSVAVTDYKRSAVGSDSNSN